MKELISVIIPTFNRENTIIRAIESVLNQTYDKLEVIVVDDGSTDRTPDLLKNIVDERVRYYANYENVGPLGARNRGIDLARGIYVAFQDSDDVWNKDKIEKQVKRVPSSNNDLSSLEGNIYHSLLQGNKIGIPTMLVKKDVFNEVGKFDELCTGNLGFIYN